MGVGPQMAGALAQGVRTLSDATTVTFRGYSRTVLPIDGYIFWIPCGGMDVEGSLHYAEQLLQNVDETFGDAAVTFTALEKVPEFESMSIDTIYIGEFDGIKFAFPQQMGHYDDTELWHYFGHRIAPAMMTQLLDRPEQIDASRAIVSDSLPFWLQLRNYKTPYADFFANTLPLYPGDMVASNMVPPYGVIDVQSTVALQATPRLSRRRTHHQLASDTVEVTLYGLQSNEALDFLDCVTQYTVLSGNLGIMNMPIVSDSPRRKQVELQTTAMRKKISFVVSYNQIRVADIARQLILSAQMEITAGTYTGTITAP